MSSPFVMCVLPSPSCPLYLFLSYVRVPSPVSIFPDVMLSMCVLGLRLSAEVENGFPTATFFF